MREGIPALPITDMRKSEDFYRDKLGFTVIYHEGGFIIMKYHHVEIQLWIASDESWHNRNNLADCFGCRIVFCRYSQLPNQSGKY